MYADKQICICLICQLNPLIQRRIRIRCTCIVHPDPAFILIKQFFQLLHDRQIKAFFRNSKFYGTCCVASVSGIHHNDFIIDIVRINKIKVKASLFEPVFQFIHLIQLKCDHALFLILIISHGCYMITASLDGILLEIIIHTARKFDINGLRHIIIFNFYICF